MHFFCSMMFLGVCQANDIDDASILTGWHKHNNTMEHPAKRPPTAHGYQPHAVKGECPVRSHPSYLISLSGNKKSFQRSLLYVTYVRLPSIPRPRGRYVPEIRRLLRGPVLRQTLLVSHL